MSQNFIVVFSFQDYLTYKWFLCQNILLKTAPGQVRTRWTWELRSADRRLLCRCSCLGCSRRRCWCTDGQWSLEREPTAGRPFGSPHIWPKSKTSDSFIKFHCKMREMEFNRFQLLEETRTKNKLAFSLRSLDAYRLRILFSTSWAICAGFMTTVGTKLRKMWLQSVFRAMGCEKAISSSSRASSNKRSPSFLR